MNRLSAAVLAGALLVAGGCGSKSSSSSDASANAATGAKSPDALFGEIASFEVIAGRSQSVSVGLTTTDGRILAGGEVSYRIIPATGGDPVAEGKATYRGVFGMPAVASGPRIGRPSEGTGVYSATDVTIPTAGFWTMLVTFNGKVSEASFEALTGPRAPDVGEDAPRTQNLTLSSPGVQPEWLDSAASADVAPDPLLHSTVIADAIAAKRPTVVVVSTPAYCTSRFCGPTNELVSRFAKRDADAKSNRAYVHLEVWKDYDGRVLNKAAFEWVMARGAGGREPWVFLIGSDGKIARRFDNVVPEADLAAAIDELR